MQDRLGSNAQSLNQVAHSIIKNIRERKFRTTLTRIGKLNALLQPIVPDLVERILINSGAQIKARSV